MNRPTLEEQRELVRRWEETGQELERLRRERLRGMPYNWEDVDTLLRLGEDYDGPPRLTSGLVEMQRLFMIAARISILSGTPDEDRSDRPHHTAPNTES